MMIEEVVVDTVAAEVEEDTAEDTVAVTRTGVEEVVVMEDQVEGVVCILSKSVYSDIGFPVAKLSAL
jgi:hypothetical protein